MLTQAEAELSADAAASEEATVDATEATGDGTLPAAVGFVPVQNPGAALPAGAMIEQPGATAESATLPGTGSGPGQTAAAEKRGFLSTLFSSGGETPPVAAATQPPASLDAKPTQKAEPKPEKPTKPLIELASTGGAESAPRRIFSEDALPGVRKGSLFEITRKSGLDDDSDIDLHEDEPGIQVASAAGLARLAPNGLIKQTESVDVACLKPTLVRMLKTVEQHFGKKMIITSGYRSPQYNKRVRGARNSMHMYCAAADVQVPGVDKWQLARFVRSLPGRGGVGTYCHTKSVHVDVGPERDWNWRCRKS